MVYNIFSYHKDKLSNPNKIYIINSEGKNMLCKKCGIQNTDDTKVCTSCGENLTSAANGKEEIQKPVNFTPQSTNEKISGQFNNINQGTSVKSVINTKKSVPNSKTVPIILGILGLVIFGFFSLIMLIVIIFVVRSCSSGVDKVDYSKIDYSALEDIKYVTGATTEQAKAIIESLYKYKDSITIDTIEKYSSTGNDYLGGEALDNIMVDEKYLVTSINEMSYVYYIVSIHKLTKGVSSIEFYDMSFDFD
jgi:hypothetical protein